MSFSLTLTGVWYRQIDTGILGIMLGGGHSHCLSRLRFCYSADPLLMMNLNRRPLGQFLPFLRSSYARFRSSPSRLSTAMCRY
jgi:hypothetical protein